VVTNPKQDFKKSHIFDVQNGIMTTDNHMSQTRAYRPVNTDANLSIAQTSAEFDATQTMRMGADLPRRLPTWVQYDRKVLRFYAYFKEAVFSSYIENYRVRRCVIYFYLTDSSIHVAEPKQENSGIPQGVFIKRHRVPKANNEYVNLNDLAIGAEVCIYSRVFRIYDVDEFTRQFFANNQVDLGLPEEVPIDPFAQKNMPEPVNNNKVMYPMKEHMEASLGKMTGVNIEATQRFLKNDGKVLRFYCLYSPENTLIAEQRPYIVHYFLADDTVEVLEINQPNSGRDSFPTLLQRCKLPKDHNQTRADLSRIGTTSDHSVQYHTEEDFRIGSEIQVYGRKLFICGCDKFTKDFYMENYGMSEEEFQFLNLEDPEVQTPYMLPPPSTGFGTEEDSLGSFLFLRPKVPKCNYKKLMENDGLVLQFGAKMVDPAPEDVDRRFVIKFFMNNDTLSVYEQFQRNSGFIGGKFLERCRLKNPDTNMFFCPTDFKQGNQITINKHKFELLESDDWTKNYMANNPDTFPQVAETQL
jgi:hypothetical protein